MNPPRRWRRLAEVSRRLDAITTDYGTAATGQLRYDGQYAAEFIRYAIDSLLPEPHLAEESLKTDTQATAAPPAFPQTMEALIHDVEDLTTKLAREEDRSDETQARLSEMTQAYNRLADILRHIDSTIVELHRPHEADGSQWCNACTTSWPCATFTAVSKALPT